MTIEQQNNGPEIDDAKAWAEVEAEENPTLALAKLELEQREQAANERAAASMQEPGEIAADDPIALALAAADAELDAAKPAKKDDPTVVALNQQIATLQQQMQAQKEADDKRVRDLNGAFGGLKRELDQVRAEAAAAKAATASNPAAQAAIKEAEKTPEKWAALKEEWKGTGMTEAIEEFVVSQKAAAPPPDVEALLNERMKTEREANEQRFRQQQAMIVDLTMNVAHPGWRDTVKKPEFVQWRAAQPPAIQQLASSPNPQDAIHMLNLFATSTAGKPAADKTKQTRLENAVSHTRTEHEPRRTLSVDDMTPEQLWAYESRLEEQAARRAH